jgi:hypothetical protein
VNPATNDATFAAEPTTLAHPFSRAGDEKSEQQKEQQRAESIDTEHFLSFPTHQRNSRSSALVGKLPSERDKMGERPDDFADGSTHERGGGGGGVPAAGGVTTGAVRPPDCCAAIRSAAAVSVAAFCASMIVARSRIAWSSRWC